MPEKNDKRVFRKRVDKPKTLIEQLNADSSVPDGSNICGELHIQEEDQLGFARLLYGCRTHPADTVLMERNDREIVRELATRFLT